jgi:hypothetical protein
MPVVRAVVGTLGILAIVGALAGFYHGAPAPLIVLPVVLGLVMIAGALFERVYYKRLAGRAPGAGWVATGERFVDPATGRLVEVHYRPATGERAYVDAGAATPS